MKIVKIFSLLLSMIILCSLMVVPAFAEDDEGIIIGDGSCVLTIKLKDFSTDETDNIQFKIKNKDTRETAYIVFTKSNNWSVSLEVEPGTYVLTYDIADNNREIVLESSTINVPNSISASADLTVKKIINNSFFPKFFRNNTFLLILLVISSVTYFVLKKRRENGLA